MSHIRDQLLESFSGLLFDWSKVWGFTSETSLPEFVASLCSVQSSLDSPKCMLYALRETLYY